MQEFVANLNKLGDHPDRELIMSMKDFAQNRKHLAVHICDAIWKRMIDPNLPSRFKKPLFYLMDAIMVHVAEPFVGNMRPFLEKYYKIVLRDVPDQDRVKLDFLFRTWDERKYYPTELIKEFRDEATNPSTQTHWQQPFTLEVPLPGAMLMSQTTFSQQQPYQQTIAQPYAQQDQYMASTHMQPQQQPQQQHSQQQQQYQRHHHNYQQQSQVQQQQQQYAVSQRDSRYPTASSTLGQNRTHQTQYNNNQYNQQRSQPFKQTSTAIRKHDNMMGPSAMGDGESHALLVAMRDVLQRLLHGRNDSITIEELQVEDPALYNDIKASAEYELHVNAANAGSLSNIALAVSDGSDGSSMFVVPDINELLTKQSNGAVPTSSIPISIPEDNTNLLFPQFSVPGPGTISTSTTDAMATTSQKPMNTSHSFSASFQAVEAYVGGFPDVVNVDRAFQLVEYFGDLAMTADDKDSLVPHLTAPFEMTSDEIDTCRRLSKRLRHLTDNLDTLPGLPGILSGPLPVEASKEFMAGLTAAANLAAQPKTSQVAVKLPIPEFRIHPDLSTLPIAITKLHERRHFPSESKKNRFRNWFPIASSWISMPRASIVASVQPVAVVAAEPEKEYSVLADEYFVRCPISKELFQKHFDKVEKDFIYKNAVKVFVTENADKNIFDIGRPTSVPSIHYLIVRKPLIMDGWLMSGKASTLHDAIVRYETMGGKEKFVEELKTVGSGEDNTKIFLILEFS